MDEEDLDGMDVDDECDDGWGGDVPLSLQAAGEAAAIKRADVPGLQRVDVDIDDPDAERDKTDDADPGRAGD
eukprot:2446339-Pleurochrysis_carterae.AAC.1